MPSDPTSSPTLGIGGISDAERRAPASLVPPAVEAPDEEVLQAAPAPPRGERTATVLLMALTALAAAWMAFSLRGEAGYALTPGRPLEVGDLATLQPGGDLENRYIRATGLLGTNGAIRYGRAAEGDSFRLAPIAGNPHVWAEIRVPEGFEGPRFVPPTSFAGRLVRFGKSGIRHVGLADTVRSEAKVSIPEDAWLLVDGSSPRASRWALALTLLFLGFAGWNVFGVARLLGKIRDKNGDPEPADRAPGGNAPDPA